VEQPSDEPFNPQFEIRNLSGQSVRQDEQDAQDKQVSRENRPQWLPSASIAGRRR
jgi:hypothetical protein